MILSLTKQHINTLRGSFLFNRWDYDNLLSNSTFCLVPRGRRLGSFRFLATLQAGCLPLILSNGRALPFDEVLDWSSASLSMDERQLMQVGADFQNHPQRLFLCVNSFHHNTCQGSDTD